MSKSEQSARRMSRPHDARAMRSRDALQQAFLRLLSKRPLNEITIRDITNEAEVSYPVFFRRYAGKDELLQDIAAGEVQRLLTLTLPIFDTNAEQMSLEALCTYVSDHRLLWKQLLTGGAATAMRDEFLRIARELGLSRREHNPGLPVELASSFVVAAIFEILSWWLAQPEDYPIDNIIKFLAALVVRPAMSQIDPAAYPI